VFFEEGTVSSIEDVNFRIGELGVLVCVSSPVFMPYELGTAYTLVWIGIDI